MAFYQFTISPLQKFPLTGNQFVCNKRRYHLLVLVLSLPNPVGMFYKMLFASNRHSLTLLFATTTMGTFVSPPFSLITFSRNSLSLTQLGYELIAHNARKASPCTIDESRNDMYSSCPAVSMISTSCMLAPYST